MLFRSRVTPAKRGKGNKASASHAPEHRTPAQRRAAMTWAQRLKRVFNIDIETCKTCGGHLKIIACIEDPAVIEQILAHLRARESEYGLVRTRLPPSRAPPGRPASTDNG